MKSLGFLCGCLLGLAAVAVLVGHPAALRAHRSGDVSPPAAAAAEGAHRPPPPPSGRASPARGPGDAAAPAPLSPPAAGEPPASGLAAEPAAPPSWPDAPPPGGPDLVLVAPAADAGREVAAPAPAPEPPPGADPVSPATEGGTDPPSAAMEGWQAVWAPFSSEASARGFADHLAGRTGAGFRVLRFGPGDYRVAFAHEGEAGRRAVLAEIARATGLDPETLP